MQYPTKTVYFSAELLCEPYRKGSVVMHALRNEIGEARLNHALKSFLARFAFKGQSFPTSQDLLDEIRAVAPARLWWSGGTGW